MAEPVTPTIIVFDVNETLLDIETLSPLFVRLFGDGAVMREWFAQLILYSEAITLSAHYAPFGTLGAAVLKMVGTTRGVDVTDADVGELRTRMLAMPAHPEVPEALRRLRAAGFRLVTLTNSAPNPESEPLERAGLATFFEQRLSVDAVRRFKPAPECYRLIAEALGVAPKAMALVAAHVWDTIGAQSLGSYGALVARPGNALLPLPGIPQPDIVAPDLAQIADAIIARWG